MLRMANQPALCIIVFANLRVIVGGSGDGDVLSLIRQNKRRASRMRDVMYWLWIGFIMRDSPIGLLHYVGIGSTVTLFGCWHGLEALPSYSSNSTWLRVALRA